MALNKQTEDCPLLLDEPDYGHCLLDQIRSVKTTITQLIDNMIPAVHKYLLWTAETNTGFYQPSLSKPSECEETKTAEPNSIFADIDPKSVKVTIKIKDNSVSSLINDLKVPQDALARIYETHPHVKRASENIQIEVKKLLDAKDRIMSEIRSLDTLLRDGLYANLSPEAGAAFTKIIEMVYIQHVTA